LSLRAQEFAKFSPSLRPQNSRSWERGDWFDRLGARHSVRSLPAPPPILGFWCSGVTCRICLPLAGDFIARSPSPSLQYGRKAHFGLPSPSRKFPFFTPEKCIVEIINFWL